METPSIAHFSREDYEHVYEPAEDSFLFLDALEADLAYLEQLAPCMCLEIGSGSGVIITALAKKLQNSYCLATDINPRACTATKRTATQNATEVDVVHCNLLDALRPNSIDLLLFNPPYVVTTDEELQKHSYKHISGNLVFSWAGGVHGRRVIDELLEKLDTILTPNGVFYLLLLRENKPHEIITKLKTLNFKAIKFMERRIPGEYLYILKVTRH